jgi:hypothetical protein
MSAASNRVSSMMRKLRRQKMLEESSVKQRLRLLITFLQDEIGSAAA